MKTITIELERDYDDENILNALGEADIHGRIIEPEQSASGEGEVPPTTTAEKVSFIVAAVESVMGMGRSHLSASVEANNILVDDEESFSTLVTIDIKPLEGDSPTIAYQCNMQVDIVDGEAVLIWGEDDEVSLTTGNLYADLFFNSLPQADTEIATLRKRNEGLQAELVGKMVDRFLGWKLPQDFGPDCGVSFERQVNMMVDGKIERQERPYDNSWWPTGTNLFTADQAKAMILHMLGDSAAPSLPNSGGDVTAAERSDANAILCLLAKRWYIDGDYIRCKKCKHPHIASKANQPFLHDDECKFVNVGKEYPWRQFLLALSIAATPLPEQESKQ